MSERKVTTDALETLGTIHVAPQKRDAIHLAVEPVEAGETLVPGDHISVTNGVAFEAVPGKGLGIVDPFLLEPVQKGQKFWFVMYPRMVHSLRHVWTHPSFPDDESPNKEIAKAWLMDFAISAELTLEDLIAGAKDYIKNGEYLCDGGKWEGFYVDDDFWPHFENYTGQKVPESKRGNFFTCSC